MNIDFNLAPDTTKELVGIITTVQKRVLHIGHTLIGSPLACTNQTPS